MKCRLYPNKECAEKIDKAIFAVQVYHNDLVYDIFFNNINTNESVYKPKKTKEPKRKKNESDAEFSERIYNYQQQQKYKEGDTIHFLDSTSKCYGFSVEYKKRFKEKHPELWESCVSDSLTCKGGLKSDIKKSFGTNPIEFQKPKFYRKGKKSRDSYTYQESLNKLSCNGNKNVLYINLAKIGKVKIRGWNQNIRFDESGKINFIDYCLINKKSRVTVTIKKDNCGDYYVIFKLKNVYKEMKKPSNTNCGIDVGVKDVVILSDGTKFENHKYKQEEKQHIKFLNRRLSRRQGWSNEEFRDGYKQNKDLIASKRYQRTQLKLSKLHRKIARKRENYNHNITTKIINTYSFIGIETLNVTGMFRNRHLSNALSDAAMGEILSMLKYKAEWYDRIIQQINQWSPSSKRCSCCGYIRPELGLHIREWQCPKCRTYHNRDVNAAINILYYALLIYYGEEKGKEIFEQFNNKFQLLSA